MKITLELPDTTALGFMNFAYINEQNTMMLASVSIDSSDLKNGYINVVERFGVNND